MAEIDPFHHIARIYDPIMDHVDYERWMTVCLALSNFLPGGFRHVDAACGTGTLIGMLRIRKWKSYGFDFSAGMLRAARAAHAGMPLAQGDLRAAPIRDAHFITCLFDSMNFLLDAESIRLALRGLGGSLAERGVLYFDIVTERMIVEHFENKVWSEKNGSVTTHWSNTDDRNSNITDTVIRIGQGPESVLRERVYPLAVYEEALEAAGLTTLGIFDAYTWRRPGRRSTRIDIVAMRHPLKADLKLFKAIASEIRRCI